MSSKHMIYTIYDRKRDRKKYKVLMICIKLWMKHNILTNKEVVILTY